MNRFTHHRIMLRNNKHNSKALQNLWNETKENEWIFVVLQNTHTPSNAPRAMASLRSREISWTKKWPGKILNTHPEPTGWKTPMEVRNKQSAGRAIYLKTPGARELLSQRAIAQHKIGKLGRQTWKT